MGKQYGTLWLRFYIKVRFLITLILTPISMLMIYSQAKELQYYNPTVWSLSIFYILIDIAIFFFRLTVYKEMRNLLPEGYKHNDTLLLLETFLAYPLSAGIASAINYGVWGVTYMLSLFIYFLLWYLPNSVYFKKRKFLFNGEWSLKTLPKRVSQDAASTPIPVSVAHQESPAGSIEKSNSVVNSAYSKEIGNQIVCSNCGSTIRDADAKFCDHCGKRLPKVPLPSSQSFLVCKNCNTKIPDTDAKFCLYCGKSLQGNCYYVVDPASGSANSEPTKESISRPSHEVAPADVYSG